MKLRRRPVTEKSKQRNNIILKHGKKNTRNLKKKIPIVISVMLKTYGPNFFEKNESGMTRSLWNLN